MAKYTGAPYAIALDCCSNGLFLSLKYLGTENEEIAIPSRTYMSVPCAIINSGNKVKWIPLLGLIVCVAFVLDSYDGKYAFLTAVVYAIGFALAHSFFGKNKNEE